jgi:hypothetical protein
VRAREVHDRDRSCEWSLIEAILLVGEGIGPNRILIDGVKHSIQDAAISFVAASHRACHLALPAG